MSDLSKFRVDEAPPKKAARIEVNWKGVLLAVDQTLTSSGWVLLQATGGAHPRIEVIRTGMCKTNPDESKGHESNLARGELMHRQFEVVIENNEPMGVVHELPPAGGQMARPESSLLAALGLRIAAATYLTPIVMVGAQRAKNRLTNDAKASKQAVRAGVLWQLPNITDFKPLNEHIYDAAALGLVAIEEGKLPYGE